MPTLLLIDGNPIMHRAYHALPPLTSKDGTPTNVIYGFFSILYKLVNEFKPDYLATVFDTPKPTFRNQLFKDYQAQRPKIEDKFAIQIPLLKEGIKLSGIAELEKDGYEADDIIGTLTKILSKDKKNQIFIISGDKDIFQLIKDNVYVVTPVNGLDIKLYDKEEVIKKLGITPEKIPDFKALAGDPSDNYPGARGIGPKTAAKLINQFKTIENLYENLVKIDSEKIRKILIKEKDNVFLSKKLATILTDVQIDINPEKLKFKNFNEKLKEFFERYQIYSLEKRYFSNQKQNFQKKEEKKNDQISLF